jgi:hypothetical protein
MSKSPSVILSNPRVRGERSLKTRQRIVPSGDASPSLRSVQHDRIERMTMQAQTLKRSLYHLHYRQDFKLLVIDAFQYQTDYYNVDYVFLFTNPPPIFSAYLSKKGLRQQSNIFFTISPGSECFLTA